MAIIESFRRYKGLPRSIYILFIARIVNSMGMFVYPFLTFFLTQKIGLGSEKVGFFMLLTSLAYIPGSMIGGKLTDNFGRKGILLTFQSMAALLYIACGFMGDTMVVPWLLISAAFFGGLAEPASSAMVADITTPENRKEAFSLLYLGINIGVAVGPMIAGFLFENFTRWIFWGDGLTSLISLTLVLIFVKESKPTEEEIEESKTKVDSYERAEEGSVVRALLKRPFLVGFVIIETLLAFVYAQHAFSIPMQLTAVFGEVAGPKIFGTVMFTNALVVLALTVPITAATRKFKPIINVAIAGIMHAIGFGMLFYIESYILFIVSTVFWTMGEILTVTNVGVYIANHAPMTHRGRFNAIVSLIGGSGYALGPLIMGVFIKYNGIKMVWPVCFMLAIGAATLLYTLHKIEKGVKARKPVME